MSDCATASIDSAFVRALEAYDQRELSHVDIAKAALSAWPDEGAAAALKRVPAALAALKEAGRVSYPESRSGWHRGGIVDLPEKVKLRHRSGRIKASAFPWHPNLAFAAALPASRKKKVLELISGFMSTHEAALGDMDVVPYRTRSLQIAGDEKAFDACGLVDGDTICGTVPLSAIAACNPGSALRIHIEPKGQPSILVIENLHTWHAVCGVNATMLRYRGIALGSGNEAATGSFARSLAKVSADLGAKRIEYFGDLDPAGISIARRLSDLLEAEGSNLHPAVPLYSCIMQKDPRHVGRTASGIGELDQKWLPSELLAAVLSAFPNGYVWRQEAADIPDISTAMLEMV